MIGVVGEMGECGRVWGRVCMMKEAPAAVLGGVLGAAGVVRPVLHAAAPPQESPAHAPHKRGVNATRGGGNGRGGGPTRWGERGAAVSDGRGRWRAGDGRGARGRGRGLHRVKKLAPSSLGTCLRASTAAERVGRSRRRARVDRGSTCGGQGRFERRARGWQGWRRTRRSSRSERRLAAAGGRRRRRAGAGTAAGRAVAQGGRVGTSAGALTCEKLRRESKRHLFGQGGKGARKAGGRGLRGLCEAEGVMCGRRPLTDNVKNLDRPRLGVERVVRKRSGSGGSRRPTSKSRNHLEIAPPSKT